MGTLEKYSIQHKVGSITADNGSNILPMLSKIGDELGGDGVNELGGTVKIQCMYPVLNTNIQRYCGEIRGTKSRPGVQG